MKAQLQYPDGDQVTALRLEPSQHGAFALPIRGDGQDTITSIDVSAQPDLRPSYSWHFDPPPVDFDVGILHLPAIRSCIVQVQTENHRSVPGAEIFFDGGMEPAAITDDSGSASLSTYENACTIHVQASGYSSAQARIPAANESSVLTVELMPVSILELRFVDQHGTPAPSVAALLSGAAIDALPKPWGYVAPARVEVGTNDQWVEWSGRQAWRILPDGSGVIRVSGLPAEMEVILQFAPLPGVPSSAESLGIIPSRGLLERTVVVMNEKTRLKGMVLSDLGEIVCPAQVIVTAGAQRNSWIVGSVEVDANGAFALDVPDNGEVVVWIDAKGYSEYRSNLIQLPYENAVLECTLSRGRDVLVTVLDENGASLPSVIWADALGFSRVYGKKEFEHFYKIERAPQSKLLITALTGGIQYERECDQESSEVCFILPSHGYVELEIDEELIQPRKAMFLSLVTEDTGEEIRLPISNGNLRIGPIRVGEYLAQLQTLEPSLTNWIPVTVRQTLTIGNKSESRLVFHSK